MHDCCGVKNNPSFNSMFNLRHLSQNNNAQRSSFIPPINNPRRRPIRCCLEVSTIDADVSDESERMKNSNNNNNNNLGSRNDKNKQLRNRSDNIFSWNDILPMSLFASACLVGAIIVSTYEDYDVTHTRPSPSTLRLPTISCSGKESSTSSIISTKPFNFIGAATRGMAWGPSNRGVPSTIIAGSSIMDDYSFEEWYGVGATTLQWKPSYNEIMLQHRLERVPRWHELRYGESNERILPSETRNSMSPGKEQLKQAVLQLYQSLDELEKLKSMADDYMWDEMKEHLHPSSNTIASEPTSEFSLPIALEYSMDILKSLPSYYDAPSAPSNDFAGTSRNQINSYSNNNMNELPNLIGFDWGSCAWRHCGAKADAQEAIAELYNNVGMLEPFECRFIIGKCGISFRSKLCNGSIL